MKLSVFSVEVGVALVTVSAGAQPFDIFGFDEFATGPWSSISRTTRGVPKVPNGSVILDGTLTAAEYGGFQGVPVEPGDPATEAGAAWILSFPDDRTWDGPEDSSFTFWLAHDDTYLYVGVEARDDVVHSDDPNTAFWRDDAIEIVVDALNDRYDNNTDNSNDPYGGHCYFNFEGRFSRWNDQTGEREAGVWSTAVDWTYGESGDVDGVGREVPGGWRMEARFNKRLFESPDAGNRLRNGYRMGFNIGLDDDDRRGTGPGGDASRSQDLEIQYFWSNRERLDFWTEAEAAAWTPEEIAYGVHESSYVRKIDATGRLAHGGSGEIVFGFDRPNGAPRRKILFLTSSTASPINGDPAFIALLEASHDVTLYTAAAGTPEDIQALLDAVQGQDLVIMSETIGSGTVVNALDGPATRQLVLKDVDIPIISFEAFMFDDAYWTARAEDGSNDFVNWGNSSRAEVPADILEAFDSLHIRLPNHPIAGGMTGEVKVYDVPYSLNWGVTSADADVVASILPDGRYPTLFVYEEGDRLVDGSVAPNLRIGLFVGQAAAPDYNYPTRYNFLSEEGLRLFMNTVDYALGSGGGGEMPVLSVARSGDQIVVTFAGGQLQGAPSVGGPWTNEAGVSPLSLATTGAAKFFRVLGN